MIFSDIDIALPCFVDNHVNLKPNLGDDILGHFSIRHIGLLLFGLEIIYNRQNGFKERFYREFKLELDAKHLDRFECLGEVAEAIAKQLHYYNTSRIHTALKTNPAAYAARFEKENKGNCKQSRIKSKAVIQQITTGVRDRVLQKIGA